ncbi:unnamed protein product [Parnassius apollo]|uniref:(apollo) hypothetical protein n=1 Tax=Parnassius apollo TaxID=110799 RepID=A0A8S3X6U7_PARAO|nr:unnamed protein product [Parnassius apollo]
MKARSQSKSEKDDIDLLFETMAKTVKKFLRIEQTCTNYDDSEENYDYRQIEHHALNFDKGDFMPNMKLSNKESLEGNILNKLQDKEQYEAEKMAGDITALLGTNVHYSQPNFYKDLGRRFIPQYPYHEIAPPELVLAVAKESALLERARTINPTDEIIRKHILRTGEMLQARIKAGSKLYRLISVLKQISPRLIYVINNDKNT